MTGWSLFFTFLGVAFLTVQLFRLIDLIERPSRRPAALRKTLPEPWLPRAASRSFRAAVRLAHRRSRS